MVAKHDTNVTLSRLDPHNLRLPLVDEAADEDGKISGATEVRLYAAEHV